MSTETRQAYKTELVHKVSGKTTVHTVSLDVFIVLLYNVFGLGICQ